MVKNYSAAMLTKPYRLSRNTQIRLSLWGLYNTKRLLFVAHEEQVTNLTDQDTNNLAIQHILLPLNISDPSILATSRLRQPTIRPLLGENQDARERRLVGANDLSQLSASIPPIPSPVGGKISCYLQQWRRITSDQWVLNIIQFGHSLEFIEIPQTTPPLPRFQKHLHLLKMEVSNMLQKGAIERVPFNQRGKGFYSRFFLIRKKLKNWRPILDMRNLNKYFKKQLTPKRIHNRYQQAGGRTAKSPF